MINSENEMENLVVDENMERIEEIKIRNTGQEMIEENLLLANRQTRCKPKPSKRLIESREYLTQENDAMVPGAFTTIIRGIHVPQTYREAMKEPEAWVALMMREIEMMRVKVVYELVDQPVDKNVVGSKWVFSPKFDGEGSLASRKAQIVAQGFTQVQGVDFKETYAATACLESFQLLLAVVASKNLHLWQLDFVAAYLNSNINFNVYIEQSEGFVEGGGQEKVWKLHKTLYGTIQGRHNWFKTLSKAYQELGYH